MTADRDTHVLDVVVESEQPRIDWIKYFISFPESLGDTNPQT